MCGSNGREDQPYYTYAFLISPGKSRRTWLLRGEISFGYAVCFGGNAGFDSDPLQWSDGRDGSYRCKQTVRDSERQRS